MKQKSPELEIPEGIFYDGIPGSNIYVQKKDLNTGMLYGIMIYRQTGSYEDQAIILADSGMMQSTAEKKHLILNLYSGEWFENMRSQDLANNANIPYRRETFSSKRIVLDFDGGFNLADMNDVAGDARAKSLNQILHDLDSLKEFNDSVGRAYYNDSRRYTFRKISLPKNDSVKLIKELSTTAMTYDTLFQRQSKSAKQMAVKNAMSNVQAQLTDIEVRLDYTSWLHRNYRQHQIEAIGKFTLALSCLIFFFIGAPLGAIIRKGGLGMPVIISVLVFIVYYIFDNPVRQTHIDSRSGAYRRVLHIQGQQRLDGVQHRPLQELLHEGAWPAHEASHRPQGGDHRSAELCRRRQHPHGDLQRHQQLQREPQAVALA